MLICVHLWFSSGSKGGRRVNAPSPQLPRTQRSGKNATGSAERHNFRNHHAEELPPALARGEIQRHSLHQPYSRLSRVPGLATRPCD